MLPQLRIKIVADQHTLAEEGSKEFIRIASEALDARRRFTVALAGGTTPKEMYTRLIEAHVDWGWVHFFWGDERCVSPNHTDSNFRMAREALLNSIAIPQENIHRIEGELPAELAAQNYENVLHHFFKDITPQFDLVLLGLGGDGHVASIFPHSPAIGDNKHWAVAISHRVPPPPLIDRVTLTMPVVNAAANVLMLVSGAEKAERLAQVFSSAYAPDLLPAQALNPVHGTLLWLVDEAAATKIQQNDQIN